MLKLLMYASRAVAVALLLCFVVSGGATTVSAQSNSTGQPSNAPKKKKKLPPGAKGFEQFANRDASDKLVTGGATRGECMSYEQLIECAGGQYSQGNIKEAVEFFQKAAALRPEMFRPHYNLGQIYEEQGKYKEAAAAYKSALPLKIDESFGDEPVDVLRASFNLANVYALLNEHALSVSTLREVLRTMPTAYTAHYNVGLSLAALGKHQEAVAAFKEATKIKADYADAYYNLGLAHSKLEEWPQAAAAFKKTLEHKPDDALAHYNLGLIYYFMDDAKALAAEVQALQKTRPELAKELSRLNGK